MYLSYEQYTAMGGTLTETVFLNYEFEAEALINYATFNRLKNDTVIPDEVTKLTKYIIDLVEKQAFRQLFLVVAYYDPSPFSFVGRCYRGCEFLYQAISFSFVFI